jgi:hypothetical protein|tara:strand:- start:12010 stop:12393 length:384 start_codon:yes stop_codon:yes gene_type:complete
MLKEDLHFREAPLSPARQAWLMLVGELALVIRRKPLWPEARLARWILPLGFVATTLTFGSMFASPAYTGAGRSGAVQRANQAGRKPSIELPRPEMHRHRIDLGKQVRRGVAPRFRVNTFVSKSRKRQ